MVYVLVLVAGLLVPILVGTTGLGTESGTTTTTSASAGGGSGGEPGDPCDPATYDGPYSCVEDPNSDGQYIIAD